MDKLFELLYIEVLGGTVLLLLPLHTVLDDLSLAGQGYGILRHPSIQGSGP